MRPRWHGRCNHKRVSGGRIQILIAEDDPVVRSLVQHLVRELGHSASCAENGAEALKIFETGGADVVVSDWMMPRMDGVELCRCVRAHGTAYTYFILLTARNDSEHRLAGMQAGADDYVAKPFNLADIEARLIAAERVMMLHRRREGLLRLASRMAGETDPERLLHHLLAEAIDLVGGSAGSVARWDEEDQALVAIDRAEAPSLEPPRLRLGEGASGRAAQQRTAVLMRRTDGHPPDQLLLEGNLESALAVPLLHEGRLLGALAVGTRGSQPALEADDATLLEKLASTAAAALVALERARLDGVMLAARTAQHELNNQLAVARGYAELLRSSPDLPAHLMAMAAEVMSAADDAAAVVRQLRTVSHIRETDWNEPGESTINLVTSQP